MAEELAPGASWWVPRQGQSEEGGAPRRGKLALPGAGASRLTSRLPLQTLEDVRGWAAREPVGWFASERESRTRTTTGQSDCQERFLCEALCL